MAKNNRQFTFVEGSGDSGQEDVSQTEVVASIQEIEPNAWTILLQKIQCHLHTSELPSRKDLAEKILAALLEPLSHDTVVLNRSEKLRKNPFAMKIRNDFQNTLEGVRISNEELTQLDTMFEKYQDSSQEVLHKGIVKLITNEKKLLAEVQNNIDILKTQYPEFAETIDTIEIEKIIAYFYQCLFPHLMYRPFRK